jgi:hypothetical protein
MTSFSAILQGATTNLMLTTTNGRTFWCVHLRKAVAQFRPR